MKKNKMIFIFALALLVLVPMAFAADSTVMPMNSMTKASSSVAATTGKISSINLSSKTPSLKVSDSSGNVTTIQLDSVATSAWKIGKIVPLSQLKTGDQVKVRHTTLNGKDVARSVEVL